jgi:8-oxo-dGTP pyrophosphatase MutT (NUDIX family)
MASEPPGVTETIRAAATAILWRDKGTGPELLMGQRGAAAVFMPSKYVFPGGAVDPEDHGGVATHFLSDLCQRRLAVNSGLTADTLVEAARRELAEETGLTLQPQGQAGGRDALRLSGNHPARPHAPLRCPLLPRGWPRDHGRSG